MACEIDEVLKAIERKVTRNLETVVGGRMVRISNVKRREMGVKPNLNSRCVLVEGMKVAPDSDIWTIVEGSCGRCGMRVSARMEKVAPNKIETRRRRRQKIKKEVL